VGRALDRFECNTVSQLQDRVLRDPALFAQLLQFLTVQVSDLFRDPTYWSALRERITPILGTWPSLKLWIAGVATGEELYSLAILLEEEGLLDRSLIYATDVNREALRAAERGIFSLERVRGFSENYFQAGGKRSLSDYYTAAYGGALFSRRLTDQVVFSDHDLATDSSFSEVQLVACRNVLIYFTKPLQERALRLFSDSLVHGGFLCLGSRETLQFSAVRGDYEPAVAEQRIYKRVRT
jgi:chemotaxis protein methyltransferase CheR